MSTKKGNIISKSILIVCGLLLVLIAYMIGTRPQEVAEWFKNLFGKIKNIKPDVFKMENFTDQDIKKGVLAVKDKYGIEMAQTVEKIFRLETGHFSSQQYRQTGTPGLVEGKWPNPVPKYPTVSFNTNRGRLNYVVWNPLECAMFLAEYIKKYSGNYARWNSTDKTAQAEYRKRVESIKPKFV
ncbi:MAG: bacterial domain protein [Bacteroidetes bacterium]|nr:bacterial domain protein [Bacteroidota bacterium]